MNCRYCGKPKATDDDWDKIPESEGDHLCWAPDKRCYVADAEDALDRALARIKDLENVPKSREDGS